MSYQVRAAWNAHDPKQPLSFMAEDLAYDGASAGGNITSSEALWNSVTFLPNFLWSPVGRPAISAHPTAFEWDVKGKLVGPWGAMWPSGRKYNICRASIIRLDRRKVTFEGDYQDQFTLHNALGLTNRRADRTGNSIHGV